MYSFSTLKRMEAQKNDQRYTQASNRAFTFGCIFEAIFLCQPINMTTFPDISGDFVVVPKGLRLGKELSERKTIRQQDIEIINKMSKLRAFRQTGSEVMIDLTEILDAPRSSKVYQPHLTGEIFGLPFEGHPDLQVGSSLYLDIKTTAALTDKSLQESFVNYDYHVQGLIYSLLAKKPVYFLFFFKNGKQEPLFRPFPANQKEENQARIRLRDILTGLQVL